MAKFHKKTITLYDELGSGLKKVTAASTPETLGASTTIKGVLIKALADNTAIVSIGGTTAVATPTSSPIGITIKKDENPIEIKIDNLSKVYVAVAVDGEGVSYLYYK